MKEKIEIFKGIKGAITERNVILEYILAIV